MSLSFLRFVYKILHESNITHVYLGSARRSKSSHNKIISKKSQTCIICHCQHASTCLVSTRKCTNINFIQTHTSLYFLLEVLEYCECLIYVTFWTPLIYVDHKQKFKFSCARTRTRTRISSRACLPSKHCKGRDKFLFSVGKPGHHIFIFMIFI